MADEAIPDSPAPGEERAPESPAGAAASSVTSPAPVASPAAVDWAGHIPAEYAKDKLWEPLKGKDLATVLKGYAEGQKARGAAIPLPKADATPEDLAAWKKEHGAKLTAAGLLPGAPETPDAYQIERPAIVAEMGWSDEREAEFRKDAHAMGLNNAQVQGLVDWQARDLTRTVQAGQAAIDAATAELEDEWGANFDAKLGRAEQFLNATFDPATKAALKKSGVNNLPGFIRGLVKAGSRMAEHGDLPGTVEGQPSRQDIDARIAENREAAAKERNPQRRVELAEELHKLHQQRLGDENKVHVRIG